MAASASRCAILIVIAIYIMLYTRTGDNRLHRCSLLIRQKLTISVPHLTAMSEHRALLGPVLPDTWRPHYCSCMLQASKLIS